MGWAGWVLGLDGPHPGEPCPGLQAPLSLGACLVPVWSLGRRARSFACWGYLGQPGLWCTQ
jgi:hypothetical protein